MMSDVGLDESEKSGTGTLTAIVAILVKLLKTPVTFTMYVPGAILSLADIVSRTCPGPVMVVELTEADNPSGVVEVMCTTPFIPLASDMVITEASDEPSAIVREATADMEKSGFVTSTNTWAECDNGPLDPLTLME